MAGPVALRGMQALGAAFAKAEREERLGLRHAMRDIAVPVQTTAQTLARNNIPRIGEQWWRMRIGNTRKLLYVAPRQRGVKSRNPTDPRRRPQFGDLLLARAMEPARERHAPEFEKAVERMLEQVADGFNHGGGHV